MKSTTTFSGVNFTNNPNNPRRVMAAGMTRLIICFLLMTSMASALANPLRVDLRADQSGIRDQNPRGSCTYHAIIAAMEAAYKRDHWVRDGEDLNLSEQFFNHAEKMFQANGSLSYPPNYPETGLGPTDGGSMMLNLELLTINKLKLPLESAMEYRHYHCDSIPAWPPWLMADRPFNYGYDFTNAFFTESQFNTDTMNLNPQSLPVRELSRSLFYGISSYKTIDSTDTNAMETALAENHEVMVDVGLTNDIWLQITPALPITEAGRFHGEGAHSWLVVGYDRTDPNNRYFIVKNSWGPMTPPSAPDFQDHFQYVSYEFMRRQSGGGAYITSVPAPTSWHELQFLGRWNLESEELRGTLDIYHIPGMATASVGSDGPDHRLGTFFDLAGHAFRVNGTVNGDDLDFYIDLSQPNPGVAAMGGRHHRFHILRQGNLTEMAGIRIVSGNDPGGYARKDLPLLSSVTSSGALQVSTYFGIWNVNFDGIVGTMEIYTRNDAAVPAGWAGLFGTITYNISGVTYTKNVKLQVAIATPSVIELRIPRPDDREYFLDGTMLNWNRGVVAGEGTDPWWAKVGFYANRIGDIVKNPPAGIIISNPPEMAVSSTAPTGAVVNFTVTATNMATGQAVPVTCSPASGSVFPFGTTTVICRAGTNNLPDATSSFQVRVGLPELSIRKVGDQVLVSWSAGILQETDSLNGPWRDLQNVNNPYVISTKEAATRFYRTRR